MAGTVRISITIDKSLYDQSESLAQQLNLSRSGLFGIAMENFIKNTQGQTLIDRTNQVYSDQPNAFERESLLYQGASVAGQINGGRIAINQGDIYWIPSSEQDGLEPGYTHPYVVVQDNLFNHSRIHTVVVCALTSNVKRTITPGNVLLEAGEANLPRRSVVEVSKISSVDKTQLGGYIGTLDERRRTQILAGMRFLHRMAEPRADSFQNSRYDAKD